MSAPSTSSWVTSSPTSSAFMHAREGLWRVHEARAKVAHHLGKCLRGKRPTSRRPANSRPRCTCRPRPAPGDVHRVAADGDREMAAPARDGAEGVTHLLFWAVRTADGGGA